MKNVLLLLWVSLIVLCSSCNFAKDMDHAKAAVARFHEQLNSERFAEIYAEADAQFRASTPEPRFNEFMSAIHRKLGNVTEAKISGWRVNNNLSGSFVSLSYKTAFGAEQATEAFEFRESGGKELLLNYNVNSQALIVK